MPKELELIASEFGKSHVIVHRKDINLYGTNIQAATAPFLRIIESECKRKKQSKITVLVIISNT